MASSRQASRERREVSKPARGAKASRAGAAKGHAASGRSGRVSSSEERSAPSLREAPPASTDAFRISLATLGRAGDFGSLAHYADPAYYQLTYGKRRHDVKYYVAEARSAGKVLEYGCGNGRITIPMAQAGAHITAVDLSQPMLADFARRLEQLPAGIRSRIELQYADMRSFSTSERYPLVIAPFNTLLHLYAPEEFLAFARRAREHLEEGGRLVFDVSLPQATDLSHDPDEHLESPDFTHPETGERFAYSERFEYDPIRQLLVVWMHFSAKDGSTAFTIPLAHRQYFPQELRGLLLCAGFTSIDFFGDFGTEPADAYTDSLVVVCSG